MLNIKVSYDVGYGDTMLVFGPDTPIFRRPNIGVLSYRRVETSELTLDKEVYDFWVNRGQFNLLTAF